MLLIALFIACGNLGMAKKSDMHEKIAKRLEIADSLHSIGKTDSAALVGEETIRLANENKEPTLIVGAYAAQGVFLRSLGKVNEALESYGKALDIVTSGTFRNNPDAEAIEQIGSLYINLAVLNLDMQHKDQASENAIIAGEWISKSPDPELKSMIYGVAGSVLTGCGNLQKAMEFQKLAYSNALESGDKEAAFRASAYTMLVADRLKDKQEAERMRRICKELWLEVPSMMARLVYLQAECSIALKNDRPKEAEKWFGEILSLEGIDNLPFVKFDCYNNLHLIQASLGEYKEAYETLLQSNELRDSIWEKEKTENLNDLTIKYKTKETQLALAESEAKRSTILMWLFIALTALLLAVVIFVAYAGRQRRRRMQKEFEFANLRENISRRLTQEYIEGLEMSEKGCQVNSMTEYATTF